jgi:hypothetical protein
MQLPQKQLTITVVTGLAALLAALALAVIAASPSYAKTDLNPQPLPPATTQAGLDLRAPDRQAPAPEPQHRAFSGSASTTDTLGPEDGGFKNGPATVPAPQRGPVQQPSVSGNSDGLELWSAAAGAGMMFTLGLAGLMAYALTIRRREAVGTSSTTVAAGH